MNKIKVAIVGFGNVGCSALEALLQEPDMELAGIVDLMDINKIKSSLNSQKCSSREEIKIVNDIDQLGKVDVALVCAPSRSVKSAVSNLLEKGINTVDSFDIHPEIPMLKNDLDVVAKKNNRVSIISAGWDPGIDSVIRGWFLAMAPKGITHTNYGPGMSMGHTCAVKDIPGVKNALSVTVPAGMGIHRRMVYVELQDGARFEDVEISIKTDPYFIKDRTYVFEVDDVRNLIDVGHGVLMERKGVSGTTHNQIMKFEMRINNPALTSQVMVSAARATVRQKPGCYTMIELPVIDFLHGSLEDFVTKLV
ncbi:MAG TPA: diaminopimelate dehydrogenase [Ignavibacteriaceae bacterium]|nr:diaminopimelate dehydrogenase [Ignavibacteriaceae bacterium]